MKSLLIILLLKKYKKYFGDNCSFDITFTIECFLQLNHQYFSKVYRIPVFTNISQNLLFIQVMRKTGGIICSVSSLTETQ